MKDLIPFLAGALLAALLIYSGGSAAAVLTAFGPHLPAYIGALLPLAFAGKASPSHPVRFVKRKRPKRSGMRRERKP